MREVAPRRVHAFLLAAMLGTVVSFSAPQPARAETAVVSVADLSLEGSAQSVQVRLEGFSHLGSVDFRLVFDPAIAHVVSVETGDLTGGMYAPTSYNNTTGWVFCGWATGAADGLSGDFLLCTITFSPVGTGGPVAFGTTPGYYDFRATSGASISPTPQLGSLSTVATTESADEGEGEEENPVSENHGAEDEQQSLDEAENNTPSTEVLHNNTDGDQSNGWSVSSLIISPSESSAGAEVVVSASICNSAGESASRTVSLTVDGSTEQSLTVDVPGNSCQQVVFRVSRAMPGTYQVAIDGARGEFVVPAPETVSQDGFAETYLGLDAATLVVVLAIVVLLVTAIILVLRKA